jgi:hypothetical protein
VSKRKWIFTEFKFIGIDLSVAGNDICSHILPYSCHVHCILCLLSPYMMYSPLEGKNENPTIYTHPD